MQVILDFELWSCKLRQSKSSLLIWRLPQAESIDIYNLFNTLIGIQNSLLAWQIIAFLNDKVKKLTHAC